MQLISRKHVSSRSGVQGSDLWLQVVGPGRHGLIDRSKHVSAATTPTHNRAQARLWLPSPVLAFSSDSFRGCVHTVCACRADHARCCGGPATFSVQICSVAARSYFAILSCFDSKSIFGVLSNSKVYIHRPKLCMSNPMTALTSVVCLKVEDVSSSVEELAFVDEELTDNRASCNLCMWPLAASQPDDFARCCAIWQFVQQLGLGTSREYVEVRRACWKDLDTDELGGNASWAPANDSRYVTGYKVQL